MSEDEFAESETEALIRASLLQGAIEQAEQSQYVNT